MPDDGEESDWRHVLETSYEHLYTTNQLPHTDQTGPIHQLLDDAESTLVTLDTEIASLRLQLNKRLAHRNELTCFISNHKFVLSRRIFHLPPELMLRIFELACPWACIAVPPELLGERDSDVSYGDNTLWAISQVCQSWRALALSHAPLWCTFSICLEPIVRFRTSGGETDSTHRRPSPASRQVYSSAMSGTYRMQKHLGRSRGLPLNIAVAADNSNEDWPPVVEPILRALGTQSARWRSVLLVLDDLDHWRLLQTNPTHTFPLLEYLKFDTHPTEDTLELEGTYPMLRTVEFEGTIPSLGNGSWQHLENLVVDRCARTQSLASVLPQMQSLRSMSLEIRVEKDWNIPSSSSTILLPQLENLTLTVDRRFSYVSNANLHLPRILSSVVAPALRQVIATGLPNEVLSGLTAFIIRSKCQIRDLQFHSSYTQSLSTLRALFHSMPTLQTLDLVVNLRRHMPPSLAPEETGRGLLLSLEQLGDSREPELMLPSLAHISINIPSKPSTIITAGYIREVIGTLSGRFAAGALRSAVLDISLPRPRGCQHPDEGCVRAYQLLRDNGSDIRGTWAWTNGQHNFGFKT